MQLMHYLIKTFTWIHWIKPGSNSLLNFEEVLKFFFLHLYLNQKVVSPLQNIRGNIAGVEMAV